MQGRSAAGKVLLVETCSAQHPCLVRVCTHACSVAVPPRRQPTPAMCGLQVLVCQTAKSWSAQGRVQACRFKYVSEAVIVWAQGRM